MGRRKIYFSDVEKRMANNEKVKKFYWRNKEKLDNAAKVYYWKKKIKKYLSEGLIDMAEKAREIAIERGVEEHYLIIDELNKEISE